jgi:hypothetical protein
MAMKALNLYKMNKKPEALELCDRAKEINKKTHLTWHVAGILYRSEE